MIKDATNLPVSKLLGTDNNNQELIYKIPPYQREYSWKKEDWENLFNDINENDEGYFLGSMICISQDGYMDLIDGQQRVTTISILLNSIYTLIKNKVDSCAIDIKIRKYRKVYDDLEDKLILDDEYTQSRLTLSIQNNNNNDYKYLLFINGFHELLQKPNRFRMRKISKAYEYFQDRLKEVDENGALLFDTNKLLDFYNKVIKSMVVKIEVNDISSAFTLFESINNRGIPLTPIDLIKNSIIGQMEQIDKDPESTNKSWQTIINNIESYDAQVRFLRHYYHAFMHQDKVKLNSYAKATKSNIIKIYSEHILKDVQFIFNDLINKSNVYSVLVHPEDIVDEKYLPYKDMLVDLKVLKIAPAYSLLLYLFECKIDSDLIDILNVLEKWYIRRHMTDFPGTSKLDQIFLDLINLIASLDDKKITLDIVIEYLYDKKRYINDDDFKEFLLTKDIYDVNPSTTRYMLIKLEKSKRTKEDRVDFWELTDKKKAIWSVEHILPQNPAKDSKWDDNFSIEEHRQYIHKLGNLTVTAYNSNLSNKSFEDKCIKGEYNLKSGKIQLNEFLLNVSRWTSANIEARGNLLAEEIVNINKKESKNV